MTQIERDLRYLAAEERLDTILSLLGEKSGVPQPAGALVADAYQDGRLSDHSTCLHIIAFLLG